MTRHWMYLLAVMMLVVATSVSGSAQQESIDELRAKAEQGDSISQFELGLAYETGRGVPEDGIEAARWYRLAAEQGYVDAQYNLALMYANGRGVPQNDVMAYAWWSVSAAQGHENARENRDRILKRLTAEQRAKGQEIATRCFKSGYKDCN